MSVSRGVTEYYNQQSIDQAITTLNHSTQAVILGVRSWKLVQDGYAGKETESSVLEKTCVLTIVGGAVCGQWGGRAKREKKDFWVSVIVERGTSPLQEIGAQMDCQRNRL